MKHSDSFVQLATALAKAQAVFAVPTKSKQANVTRKDGSAGYTYNYADLSDVYDAVRPGLAANGLSIFSLINHDGSRPMLETILMHESGEWFSMLYPVNLTGRPQDIGGELTYARRYSTSCMLGVASEDDDDANSANGNNASTGKKPASQGQGQRNATTTGGTTTTKTRPAPQNGAASGSSGASSSGQDAGQVAQPTLREQAIAFKKKWTTKLNEAVTAYPEHAAMLAVVAKDNQAKADTATEEIIAMAKRIMVNVCNVSGQVEDKAPGEDEAK